MKARPRPPTPDREPAVWSAGIPVLEGGPLILVDTREQLPLEPWVIKGAKRFLLRTKRATLATGDYSIEGLEQHVAIERKSLPDLIGTLFGSATDSVGDRAGHQDRFRAELERMRAFSFAMLLIEASRADVWAHRYQSAVQPLTVINLVDSLMVDFAFHAVWAGNAQEASRILGFLCLRTWEQATPGSAAARKAHERGIARWLPWCGAPKEPSADATARST